MSRLAEVARMKKIFPDLYYNTTLTRMEAYLLDLEAGSPHQGELWRAFHEVAFKSIDSYETKELFFAQCYVVCEALDLFLENRPDKELGDRLLISNMYTLVYKYLDYYKLRFKHTDLEEDLQNFLKKFAALR